jgi:hypothetical protein
VGGADKKWKGNFWFCFAASVSEKSNLIMTFLFALFYIFAATRGEYNSVCAKAQSNLIVLAPPALCAHNNPAILKKYYKTAGIAPLSLGVYHLTS